MRNPPRKAFRYKIRSMTILGDGAWRRRLPPHHSPQSVAPGRAWGLLELPRVTKAVRGVQGPAIPRDLSDVSVSRTSNKSPYIEKGRYTRNFPTFYPLKSFFWQSRLHTWPTSVDLSAKEGRRFSRPPAFSRPTARHRLLYPLQPPLSPLAAWPLPLLHPRPPIAGRAQPSAETPPRPRPHPPYSLQLVMEVRNSQRGRPAPVRGRQLLELLITIG